MRKVSISIEFTIGTLEELGLGGLRQEWVSAEDGARRYSLDVGAGLANSLMEASVHETEIDEPGKLRRAAYARASAKQFAPLIFDELNKELDE